MQNRMKSHTLTKEEVNNLLSRAQVGRVATISPQGYPYMVPVHFVYYKDKIYIHGLPQGQKLDYIKLNANVGFEVDEMKGLLTEGIDVACDVNTVFNSVIITGKASLINDLAFKEEVLNQIVMKYTPEFSEKVLPENMVKGTAIIEIQISTCSGKFYK